MSMAGMLSVFIKWVVFTELDYILPLKKNLRHIFAMFPISDPT